MLLDLILLNLYLLRAWTVFEVEQTLVCNVCVQGASNLCRERSDSCVPQVCHSDWFRKAIECEIAKY